MTIRSDPPTSPLRRLAWFVLIWAASVATLAIVALLIRTVLRP